MAADRLSHAVHCGRGRLGLRGPRGPRPPTPPAPAAPHAAPSSPMPRYRGGCERSSSCSCVFTYSVGKVMQISMPPARPPAGTGHQGPETPLRGGPSSPPPLSPSPARTLSHVAAFQCLEEAGLGPHAPTPLSTPYAQGRHAGRAHALGRDQGRAPPRHPPTPRPTRKWGGASASRAHPEARWGCRDRGPRPGEGPPARIAFPGCVSLAFPDAGAAAAKARGARGAAMAG
jgi:hypothetical protein